MAILTNDHELGGLKQQKGPLSLQGGQELAVKEVAVLGPSGGPKGQSVPCRLPGSWPATCGQGSLAWTPITASLAISLPLLSKDTCGLISTSLP